MKRLALGMVIVGCGHAAPNQSVASSVAVGSAVGDEAGDDVGGSTYGGAFPRGPAPRRHISDTCSTTPGGDVLFEIEVRVEGSARLPTGRKRLHANGAWTDHETSAEGVVTDRSGCMSRTGLDVVRADLGAATWMLSAPPPDCRAVSASHTIYSVRGKVVFDARVCGDELDDRSERLRQQIVDGLDFSISTHGP